MKVAGSGGCETTRFVWQGHTEGPSSTSCPQGRSHRFQGRDPEDPGRDREDRSIDRSIERPARLPQAGVEMVRLVMSSASGCKIAPPGSAPWDRPRYCRLISGCFLSFFLSLSFEFRIRTKFVRTNERIISFLASTRRLATVDGLSLVARQDAFASG